MLAATAALFTISAVFARTLRPSVSTAIRARSQGVRSGPWTPAAPPPRSRVPPPSVPRHRRAPRPRAPARTRASPTRGPTRGAPRASAAASSTVSTRIGARTPLPRAVKPGTSSAPTTTTGTPRVSSTSSVAGTSRIDFGPAHTTTIGVRASSSRSRRDVQRRRRPPRAPGARRRCRRWRRPGSRRREAAIIVADTVVAAQPPLGERGREVRAGGLDHAARRSRAPRGPRPPARRAPARRGSRSVAGTAPAARTARLGAACHLHVLWIRQPVADQRRLEGHDRPRRPPAPPRPSGADHAAAPRARSLERQLRARPRQVARRGPMAGDGAAVERRRHRHALAARPQPADEEPGVEGVARASRVRRVQRSGGDVELDRVRSPGGSVVAAAQARWRRARRASRTATAARSSSRSAGPPAEERPRLRDRREQQVGPDRLDRARAPAGDRSPRSGPQTRGRRSRAHRRARASSSARRAADAERLGQQRVERQVQQVDRGQPRRSQVVGRQRSAAPGPPRTTARRSGDTSTPIRPVRAPARRTARTVDAVALRPRHKRSAGGVASDRRDQRRSRTRGARPRSRSLPPSRPGGG